MSPRPFIHESGTNPGAEATRQNKASGSKVTRKGTERIEDLDQDHQYRPLEVRMGISVLTIIGTIIVGKRAETTLPITIEVSEYEVITNL